MSAHVKSSRSHPVAWGVVSALLSAVVLGLPPIFGKQAILAGTDPLSVVMLRTTLAMGVLWVAYLLFWRPYIYIYPVGLIGCVLAGLFNGLGSLLYYSGLGHLNASLVQLIFVLYTLFLALFSRLDGYPISRLTWVRLGLAVPAVYLLTGVGAVRADWVAAFFVLISGALYALHVAVNQRVLYDVPAPTVALYTLTAMAATVGVAYLFGGRPALPASRVAWEFVALLTVVTVISRLALFTGVKYLGGVQAALLGLGESLATLILAILLLGETLTPTQWLGAALLGVSMLMVMRERSLGDIPQPKPWFQILAAWPKPEPVAPPSPPAPTASKPSSSADPGN
jgi:drug/metabolite transporter (DMT)-like permease